MAPAKLSSCPGGLAEPVSIRVRDADLGGHLVIPDGAKAIVVLSRGAGSKRFRDRNRFVARNLQKSGFATLLFDLLTCEEETADAIRDARHRFDILLLGQRLVDTTDWLLSESTTKTLPIGYFGAGVGAAVAFLAAAERSDVVRAIVSSSGRPDLSGPSLSHLRSPTLFLVGGGEPLVLDVNRDARNALSCTCQLTVIPGVVHLDDEARAIERVSDLATDWFRRHLAPPTWADRPVWLAHCERGRQQSPSEVAPVASGAAPTALPLR